MKLVCISDTHCGLDEISIPSGDILVHAGDLTFRGTLTEVSYQLHILKEKTKDFKAVVLICGNHDFLGQDSPFIMKSLCKDMGFHYLDESGITVEGLKFWGSPWTPWFNDWAFNADRGEELQRHWSLIPESLDVLLTHGPPFGILDDVKGEHLGCENLLKTVKKVKPRVHVFGHIHAPGVAKVEQDGTIFVNAAIMDEEYDPTRNPMELEI